MKVEPFILDAVRNLYLPAFRHIVEAELFSSDSVGRYSASRENPVCSAEFLVSPGSYMVRKNEYAGCVDIQACIGQIVQVAWGQMLKEGLVKFGSVEDFISNGFDMMFSIGSAPDMRHKRQIPTNQKFPGVIRLDKLKEFEKGIIVETEYDFNDKSCIGKSKFYLEHVSIAQ